MHTPKTVARGAIDRISGACRYFFVTLLKAVKSSATFLLAAATYGFVAFWFPDLYLDFADQMNKSWRWIINMGREYGGRNSWVSSILAVLDFGGKGGYTLFLAVINFAWALLFGLFGWFIRELWTALVYAPLRGLYLWLRRKRQQTPAGIQPSAVRQLPQPTLPPLPPPPIRRRRRAPN